MQVGKNLQKILLVIRRESLVMNRIVVTKCRIAPTETPISKEFKMMLVRMKWKKICRLENSTNLEIFYKNETVFAQKPVNRFQTLYT